MAMSSRRSQSQRDGTSGSSQSARLAQKTLVRTPALADFRLSDRTACHFDSPVLWRGLPLPHSTLKTRTGVLVVA